MVQESYYWYFLPGFGLNDIPSWVITFPWEGDSKATKESSSLYKKVFSMTKRSSEIDTESWMMVYIILGLIKNSSLSGL